MLRRVAPAAAFGGLILFAFTVHLSAGTKTVEKPMFNGHRLDWCANWGADCGEPAAEAWCIAQGFAGTARFVKAPKIGDKSPTRLIGTGAICDAAECDGFKEITCLKLDTVQPEPVEDAAAPSPAADAPAGTPAAAALPATEPAPLPAAPISTAAAADLPAPPPEPLPIPETTAATSPAAMSEADLVAEIPAEPQAGVRVITPAATPGQAAPGAPEPASARPAAAMETTEEDLGPPPPDTILLAAAGAPPLRPVLEVFETPTFNGRRLDWCRGWKDRCGKATADEFCRLNGFVEALSFAPDPKIGAAEPTRQIASGLVCDHDGCDGFAEIACTK